MIKLSKTFKFHNNKMSYLQFNNFESVFINKYFHIDLLMQLIF